MDDYACVKQIAQAAPTYFDIQDNPLHPKLIWHIQLMMGQVIGFKVILRFHHQPWFSI